MKSKMELWAENEIEIVCQREKQNSKDGDWVYDWACYESALKAFRSLLEDGHSGASVIFTKVILNRLIDGKPLSPIEDTPDICDNGVNIGGRTVYHCKRMVTDNKNIGTHVDPVNGQETRTNKATIIYSKTGTHIYPRLED